MTTKIKLTKNALKTEKENLKRYHQFLPMLNLKKKQLQLEIYKTHQAIEEKLQKKLKLEQETGKWSGVFNENIDFTNLIKIENLIIEKTNLAGLEIPILKSISFSESNINFFKYPLWLEPALVALKKLVTLNKQIEILKTQFDLLKDELRIISQRINLFEKIKIPQAKESIKKIMIFLTDFERAGMIRAKIAKEKLIRAT